MMLHKPPRTQLKNIEIRITSQTLVEFQTPHSILFIVAKFISKIQWEGQTLYSLMVGDFEN